MYLLAKDESMKTFDFLLTPNDRRVEVWTNYRPRVFVATFLSLITAIVAFNIGYLITGNEFHSFHLMSIIFALLALLTIYGFYRMGGSFSLAVKGFMIVNSLILIGFISVTGGFISPIVSLIILLPFLGFLLEKRSARIGWTIFGFVSYFIFFIIEQQNISMPQILAQKYIAFAQVFGWTLLCLGLIISLHVYNKANSNSAERLNKEYKRFAKAADLDSKSNLLNVKAYEKYLDEILTTDKEQYHGLMLVRLLNIKEISERLNRDELKIFWERLGEEFIRVAGARCKVALLNDHEIAIVMRNMQSTSSIYNVGRTLFSSVKKSIRVNAEVVPVAIQCGIAIYPNNGDTREVLLQNCELAIEQGNEREVCHVKK